jgi:hypothetical protein
MTRVAILAVLFALFCLGCNRSDSSFIRALGVHKIGDTGLTITIETNLVSVSRPASKGPYSDVTAGSCVTYSATAIATATQLHPGWFAYVERPYTSNSMVWFFDGDQRLGCFDDYLGKSFFGFRRQCPGDVKKALPYPVRKRY